MTVSTRAPKWEELVEQVAVIAEAPAGIIERDTRLIDDLGLDSVALTELAVVLIDDFGIESFVSDLEEVAWDGLTLGRLFDSYVTRRGRRPQARA